LRSTIVALTSPLLAIQSVKDRHMLLAWSRDVVSESILFEDRFASDVPPWRNVASRYTLQKAGLVHLQTAPTQPEPRDCARKQRSPSGIEMM
jgi:hypothetical protein